MIYLDNAATTLHKPPCVGEAILAALSSCGNAARGAYGSSLSAARMIYDTRCRLAGLFGCPRADHVIFTANSTEALNIAINGILQPGDHVISTDLEHNSVLRPLYRLEKERQVELSFVPADSMGRIDYGDFERLLRPNTRAVVCTHASNLTGQLLDLARIGAFTRAHNLLLIVDASQTAGVFPIDMGGVGIDVLCFTGHKSLMGPQGTGGLCIAPGVEIHPWKVGGTGIKTHDPMQPREYPTRLEAGTLNSHGIAGLHAALGWLEETGIDRIREREQALAARFYEGVRNLPNVKVYGDFSQPRAPIVTLNIGTYDSGAVSDALSEDYGIATRPGAHCAPRMHTALGTVSQGAVRFSFSWDNTEEEVDAAVRAIMELQQD